nr:RNA-directed DNA polymerase, eukaryota [Tanacetum cinerariifolium]
MKREEDIEKILQNSSHEKQKWFGGGNPTFVFSLSHCAECFPEDLFMVGAGWAGFVVVFGLEILVPLITATFQYKGFTERISIELLEWIKQAGESLSSFGANGATIGSSSLNASFRRNVRDGAERQQWDELQVVLSTVSLSSLDDRWRCDLSGDGSFQVKEVRNCIDDMILPTHSEVTRWVKVIPKKINVFVWRARRNCLPTRHNLTLRCVSLVSDSCPLCEGSVEVTQHLFFLCPIAQNVFQRICSWWELDGQVLSSFLDWQSWFLSLRIHSSIKALLEGVFSISWWYIWGFRNRTVFDEFKPRRSVIFDEIVSLSYNWCSSRCNKVFRGRVGLKIPT